MKNSKSRQMAICGLLGAVMLVMMLLGPMIPLSTFTCPGLAGMVLIVARRECGPPAARTLYGTVSVLSLFLCPDKEAAIIFVLLLGHYPLTRALLDRVRPRPLQWTAKLVVFNLSVVVAYAILFWILAPGLFTEQFASYTRWMVAGLLILGNITFLLYDFCLKNLQLLYEFKLRPKLFSNSRFKH